MNNEDNDRSKPFQSDILLEMQNEGIEGESAVLPSHVDSNGDDWIEEEHTSSQIVDFVLDVADSSIMEISDFKAESTLTDGPIRSDTLEEGAFSKDGYKTTEPEIDNSEIDDLTKGILDHLPQLGSGDGSIPQMWGGFLKELRNDILLETSPKKRGAFLFLFSKIASIFGQSENDAKSLANLAQVSGFLHRSELLERVSNHWERADEQFLDALEDLEESDYLNEDFSSLRRSSIVIERILKGNISPSFRDLLNQRVLPPETLKARFVLAFDAQRSSETLNASRSWLRSAALAPSIAKDLRTLSTYLLQESPRFFEEVESLLEKNYRPVLLLAQDVANRQGNMEKELNVLRRIVGQDVRSGKEHQKNAAETTERLKGDTTARLMRMSDLLSKLGEQDAAYSVLRDASNLSPANTMVLRSWLRQAYDREDEKGIRDAVEKLVLATKNRESRAVILERYAHFLHTKGEDNDQVRSVLQRSLSEAPQCLPSLISYGQNLILAGEYPKMFFLRGNVEEGDFQNVWRRAELLERTGATPEELVELYRQSIKTSPNNPHFFFSFERVLCRAGDWKGLEDLYKNASENTALSVILEKGNFEVKNYRLALSLYLDGPSPDEYWSELDRYLSKNNQDPAVWEMLREEVESDPGRALGRLEVLKQSLEDSNAAETLRILLWNVHIVGTRLGCGNQLAKVFEALFRSNSFFVSRLAAKGMVENNQIEKLASMTLSERRGLFWLSSEEKGELQRKMVAAELLAAIGKFEEAISLLGQCSRELNSPQLRAEIAERALSLSLRNNHWEGVLTFLPYIEEGVQGLVPHLAISVDFAGEKASNLTVLRELEFDEKASRGSIPTLLSELELAYRVKNWTNALSILQRCLRTLAAGTIDFRSFILEQACLIAEWESDEKSADFLDDLWNLHSSKKNPPIFLVGAQIRYSARSKDAQRLTKWQAIARDVFAPSLAEALAEEAVLAVEKTTPLGAADWYEKRFNDVYDSVKPYYKFMTATLRWIWQDESVQDIQSLADAVAYGDPTHGVGAYLLALGYRSSNMMMSFEKQMGELRTRHFEPVREWAETRLFFHRAVTTNQIDWGIEELDARDKLRAAPWSILLKELFLRSTLSRPGTDAHDLATEMLKDRARVATGERAILLELAEMQGEKEKIEELANDGLIAAQVLRFLDLNSNIELDIDAYQAYVKQNLIDEEENALSEFTKYFNKVGAHFIGTTWCPIHLFEHFSSQVLSKDALDSMQNMLDKIDVKILGMTQLFFTKQYAEIGELKTALAFCPTNAEPTLISAAREIFRYFVSPRNRQSARIESKFWTARAEKMADPLAGEAQYEIGRALAQAGLEDEAIVHFEKSLAFNARFLPAQVAAGRTLIHTENWVGLSNLWERELGVVEDENLIASLSFRLGFLYLRRILSPDSIRRAVGFFERVLRVQENHLPSIESLIEIGYSTRDFEMVARYTSLLKDLEESKAAKCDRLLELASVYEVDLQDHKKAVGLYSEIMEGDARRSDALFGLLRTDEVGDLSAQALVRRLDLYPSEFDTRDSEVYLLSISKYCESAREVLRKRFPLSIVNLLARVVEAFHEGKVAENELGILGRMQDPNLELFCEISTRMLHSNYVYSNRSITLDPRQEGKLVALMSELQDGGRQEDYFLNLGELAIARARRSKDTMVRISELTWMVCTLWVRGERKEAQTTIEKLLSQFSDFGPAIKLAKFFSEANQDWESAAKWYSREIEFSDSPNLVAENRVRLSKIQTEYLRDTHGALEQLEQLLEQNPGHPTAFFDLKRILLRKGDYQNLIGHFRNYVRVIEDQQEQKKCLNEMAMISNQHLREVDNAIQFYKRSIEIDGNQPRELRILAEALENKNLFREAIGRYSAAAELSDSKLKSRIWKHVGELYEIRMKNDQEALNAYKKALSSNPGSTELYERIARTSEKVGAFEEAAEMLIKLLSTKVDEKSKLNARIGITRLGKKSGDSPSAFLNNVREVLLHHPYHKTSIEIARKEIANFPGLDETLFFDDLVQELMRRDPVRGLTSAFNISNILGDFDKAFCLSAIGGGLDIKNEKMEAFYTARASMRHWPQKAIPRELANTLLPDDISPQVLEFLRLVREGVFLGLYKNPEVEKVKAKHRISNSNHLLLNLAEKWPSIFNLSLSHISVKEGVPSYTIVPDGVKVSIVLNSRWLKESEPSQLLFPMGRDLAAHSMGVAPWNEFDLDTQLSLLIAIISKYVVEWNHVPRKHLPQTLDFMKTSRWLGKQDRRIAAYAIEISARNNAASLKAQLSSLASSLERFSGCLIDNPRHLIQSNLLKKDTGAFPGAFFLRPEIQTLRKELCTAIES